MPVGIAGWVTAMHFRNFGALVFSLVISMHVLSIFFTYTSFG